MFKKLIFSLAIAMIALSSVLAQEKNVIAVTGVYNREAVNIKTVQGEKFAWDAARDSIGGQFEYTRFFAGPLGIGAEAGVTFHNKQLEDVTIGCGTGCTATSAGKVSKVAKGYFNYAMVLADRKGTFQPFVKGVVGLKNGNFGGATFGPGGSVSVRRGSSFVYGGGAGIDLCFTKSKRTCWRSGLTLTRAFNKDTSGWDATVQTGLAFKF
jgi:hypothetical protein